MAIASTRTGELPRRQVRRGAQPADAAAREHRRTPYHVALEEDGKINVFDVWESQEKFEAFERRFMPILGELAVDPGRR